MKKLLAIVAVAGFLTACGNGEEENTDMDTMTTTPVDTTTMGMDTTTMGMDTTGRGMDTTTTGGR